MPAALPVIILIGAEYVGTAVIATIAADVVVSSTVATAVGAATIAGTATALQGGSPSDVLKSAVVGGVGSYVGSYVGNVVGTEVGAVSGSPVATTIATNVAKNVTAAAITGRDLNTALLTGVASGIPLALGSIDGFNSLPDLARNAIANATVAAVTGKDVGTAVVASALQSANVLSSAINSNETTKAFFSDPANKAATTLVSNAFNYSMSAAIRGRDVSSALEASLTRSLAEIVSSKANTELKEYTTRAQEAYKTAQAQEQSMLAASETEAKAIQAFNDVNNPLREKFDKQKTLIDDFNTKRATWQTMVDDGDNAGANAYVGKVNEAAKLANAAVDDVNKYYTDNKDVLASAKKAYDDANSNVVSTKDEYNKTLATLKDTSTELDKNLVNYQSQVDAVVAKAIDPYETTKDEARQYFANQGYEATEDELNKYVGLNEQEKTGQTIESTFDPLAVTSGEASEGFTKEGYSATQDQIKEYLGNRNEADTIAALRAKYDPLATMADEATEFFKKEGYIPTEEELKNYVGNKAEVDTSRDISAYSDPRAVIEEEARAQYLSQGIPDPTREELDKYIQQRTETEVLAELDKFADPMGTTAQEARAFAAKYNLNPDSIDNLAQLTNARTSELGSRESLSEYKNAVRSTDPEYYSAQDRAFKYAVGQGKSEDEARAFADEYAKAMVGRDVETGEKPGLTRDIGPVMFGGQEGSEDYYAAPGTRLATMDEVTADQASGGGKTYYDPNVNAWVTSITPDVGDLSNKQSVTTKELADYQSGDGSYRVPNPDGSYHMYSSQGVYMGVYTGNDAFVSYEPELSPFDVKPDFAGYPIQNFGGGEEANWDSFNDSMKSVMEERGGFPVGWQQVGTDRVFIYDDGTGIGMNENGDPYALDEDEVTKMVDNGLLNTAASGYEFGSDTEGTSASTPYKNIPGAKVPTFKMVNTPGSSTGFVSPTQKPSTSSSAPVSSTSPSASSPASALQAAAASDKAQGSTLGKIPGSWVGGLGRPSTFIDPLQATGHDITGQEDSEDMYSTSPLAAAAAPRREEEMSLQPEVNYYSYGYEPSYSSIIQPYKNPSTMYAKGGEVMNSPLMAAQGGDVPHKGSHYVQGAGGGQDDLIDAKLADGEYVLDAEIVASLGDGSNKRGAEILDKWRKSIRKHKRSASIDGIPPKAKSPLEYMKGIK